MGATSAGRTPYLWGLSKSMGVTVAALAAACLKYVGFPTPAAAMQILEAADHAELEAAISASGREPHRPQPRPHPASDP